MSWEIAWGRFFSVQTARFAFHAKFQLTNNQHWRTWNETWWCVGHVMLCAPSSWNNKFSTETGKHLWGHNPQLFRWTYGLKKCILLLMPFSSIRTWRMSFLTYRFIRNLPELHLSVPPRVFRPCLPYSFWAAVKHEWRSNYLCVLKDRSYFRRWDKTV